jgi:hypothetical protein
MRKSIIPAVLVAALTAMPVMAQEGAELALQPNAPDRHIVVPGDTLWGIASKFLKDPWRWPELWKMNQEQVKSPHRIYPGNVIMLVRSGPQPELKMGDTVKLEPRVRGQDLDPNAIPSISPKTIEPFLSRPLVIEPDGLENAPRIISAQADRVYLGSGDVAYVSGIKNSALDSVWQIYRQGKPLIDPETKTALGYEAVFLGNGRVTTTGDPATIVIFNSRQEIGKGDRLVAAGALTHVTYAPHAPGKLIKGSIIGTYGGLGETGPQNIVALNKGASDGLEVGHVLAISRLGRNLVEEAKAVPWYSRPAGEVFGSMGGAFPVGPQAEGTKLPDERYGTLFVFRVFNRVSYALVMSASRPVQIYDVVNTP